MAIRPGLEHHRHRLLKVDNAAQYLLEAINAILDLSTIEAGKMVLGDTEFSLDTLLTRAFEVVGDRAREKGVALVLDTGHLPPRLRGDPTRLAQALIKLLSNALEFTQQGWVRLRCQLLAEEAHRLQLRFEVQDTGEGIAPERQAERRFTAWLGRAAGAGEGAAPIPLRGQRVLLAEDNPINQEVAHELLRSVGLLVEMADDGARAVELALARDYDLILMDLQMPVMDGLTAARRIRELAGRGTPIIAMTASALGEDRAACLAAGMNDHLAKPVDPELLYATLLRWLPLRKSTAADAGAPTAAPALPPRPLQERLADVAGFDVVRALRNVGGQAQTLERVLQSFVKRYRDGEPAMLQLAAPGPCDAARSATHSLRGACATIGAQTLHQGLQALEQALYGGADPAGLLPQARALNDALVALVQRLAAELAR